MGGLGLIVDVGPGISDTHVVRRVVVVNQRVVVEETPLDQQLVRDRRELPPRRDVSDGAGAGTLLNQVRAVVQDLAPSRSSTRRSGSGCSRTSATRAITSSSIFREALIKTKTHILPKGNIQNIYWQKSPALP